MKLTNDQREELDALRQTNDALKGPSFLMRRYYHDPVVGPLVRAGLIAWGDPPEGFDKRMFAGVTITDAGREALSQ